MSGLLRRLTRRRPATADENPSPTAGSAEPAAAPADAPAETGGDRPVPAGDQTAQTQVPATADEAAAGDRPTGDPAGAEQPTQILPSTGEQPAAGESQETSPGAQWATSPASGEPTGEQPTAFAAQPAPSRDLPAGVDPGDLSTAPPASARRGKLRRRLRYLRHVRELLLRDLGGFTYEVHRTAGGTPQDRHRKLSEAKANRIAALDAEVGAIEARLGEPHAAPVLREAGIGGTCPECGELHASDARFCSRCGAPLDAKARAQRHAAAVIAAKPTPEPAPPDAPPASVLWAGGPRPSAGRVEPSTAEERPAPITSEWLAAQPTTFERPEPAEQQQTVASEGKGDADEAAASGTAEPPTAEEPPTIVDDQTPSAPGEPASLAGDEPVSAAGAPPSATESAGDQPESATGDQPESAAGDEPASRGDDTPPASGEPASAESDEPATGDEPTAATGDDAAERSDDPQAEPKRTSAKKPADDPPEASNGRRDDDVPPPFPSGDPLASQREQGS